MASSRDLRVDVAGVQSGAATTAAAASVATPPAAAVTPCAADATSVQVATGFTGRIGALGVDTIGTNLKTGAAAARLHGDADAYELQEAAGAAGLAAVGAAVGEMAAAPNVPTPSLPGVPAATGVPAGIVPTSGQEISAVVHSGPGPQPLLVTAVALDATAAELEQAAASVRAASSETTGSWSSGAADAAETHLAGLESSYSEQASQARALANQIRGHADDFARAKAAIPTPEVFADLQRRLQAAYAANAHPASMGRFSGQITDLQMKLAAANQDALNGYGRYQQAGQIHAATIEPHTPQPEKATPAPASAPQGAGGDEETNHAGTDTDTRDPADPLADPGVLGDTGAAATGVMDSVLPAVLGAVSGAAGGLLGALSGAGAQLQQAGNQALGGLAQGANAAMGSAMGKPSDSVAGGGPQSPELGGFDPELGGGGPEPGDTEPAAGGGGGGAGGPLSAPAGAPAVAAAAPATFSAAPPATTSGAAGAPMGGGMMPPMMPMGGRPGGGSGEDDRRLYPERRMRIETPPNSEPVRGRREARRGRADKTAEGDGER